MEVGFILKRHICIRSMYAGNKSDKFCCEKIIISSVALPRRCSSKPKNVFVVVPGNPGLSGFYETLMILLWRGLSDTSDTAIWRDSVLRCLSSSTFGRDLLHCRGGAPCTWREIGVL